MRLYALAENVNENFSKIQKSTHFLFEVLDISRFYVIFWD